MKHYRTAFEQDIADQLTAKGVSFKYEPARLRYLDRHGSKRITRPDFLLMPRSNDPQLTMFVEAKTTLRREHTQKYESLKASRPDVDLRIIFADPQRPIEHLKIEDATGTTRTISHAEWADMNNILWNGQTVPNKWLKELKKK